MSPEVLAQRLALLQHWVGREISTRQAMLHPHRPWPVPRTMADATVTIDPSNDKLYPSVNSNHVEHFGTSGLASRAILAEIVEIYRAANVDRFFFYLSPSDQADEIRAWLTEFGLVNMVDLSVLWRPATPLEMSDSRFQIDVCTDAHAERLSTVVMECGDDFGYAPATVDMIGSPNFHTLLATRDDVPAATGSLYVHEDLGYLGNGKTLEPYQNQGAQTALISARLSLAHSLGCTDLVSETYRFLESSLNNLKRAGFVELFNRSIYRWESMTR